MQKRFSLVLFTLAIGLVASTTGTILHSAEEDARSNGVAKGADGSQQLVAELKKAFPDLPIQSVYETPVPGLFGIELPGGQNLYGTADGQFIISGDMYRLGTQIVNLAEQRRAVSRKAILDGVPIEEMVVFAPSGPTKAHVSVFTDVDCTYCRKFHQEMDDINALGIEVRYLAYPRRGLDNPTYDKIVSAWCSENPNEAITELKAGRNIPASTCENPVADQYALGQRVGVKGTPAIITAGGELLPGYMPAADLAARIGLQ